MLFLVEVHCLNRAVLLLHVFYCQIPFILIRGPCLIVFYLLLTSTSQFLGIKRSKSYPANLSHRICLYLVFPFCLAETATSLHCKVLGDLLVKNFIAMLLFMALCFSSCTNSGCGSGRLIIVPGKSQAPNHYLNLFL